MPGWTRACFERKVQLLEEWAAAGTAPPDQYVPDGPVALARWEDADLDLHAWASPNVVQPAPGGRHGDLRKRFDEALATLFPGGTQTLDEEAQAETVALRSQNAALAEQIVQMQAEMDKLGTALARTNHLLALERKRCAGLQKIHPIGLVQVTDP